MTGVYKKKKGEGDLGTKIYRKESHVMMEAEIGVLCHKPRNTRGLWGQEEARKHSLLES